MQKHIPFIATYKHTNTHTFPIHTLIIGWRQGWCHVIVKVSYVTPKKHYPIHRQNNI